MLERERHRSLKVRHNNVLGYFVEAHGQPAEPLLQAAAAPTFVHRQTLANAMRFTTRRAGRDSRRAHRRRPAERALAIEQEIFERLARSGRLAGSSRSQAAARRWPSSTSPPASPNWPSEQS